MAGCCVFINVASLTGESVPELQLRTWCAEWVWSWERLAERMPRLFCGAAEPKAFWPNLVSERIKLRPRAGQQFLRTATYSVPVTSGFY